MAKPYGYGRAIWIWQSHMDMAEPYRYGRAIRVWQSHIDTAKPYRYGKATVIKESLEVWTGSPQLFPQIICTDIVIKESLDEE